MNEERKRRQQELDAVALREAERRQRSIGRLVEAGGALELLLTEVIVQMIGAKPGVGQALFYGTNVDQLVKHAQSVAALALGDTDGRELVVFLNETVRPLYARRNRVVHSTWAISDDGTARGFALQKGGDTPVRVTQDSTPEQIDGLAVEIEQATWRLATLLARWQAPPAGTR